MIPFNPSFIYVALAALLLGFGTGWKVRDWKAGADAVASVTDAVEHKDKVDKVVNIASTKFESKSAEADARERVVVKEVNRVVQKVVYRDRCLDDDGMRILTDDVAATNARRELASALPPAPPTNGPE